MRSAILLLVLVQPSPVLAQPAPGYALRFLGQGVAAPDLDRVKIPVDDPVTNLPGPPADIGATDITIEFWLRGILAENGAAAVACGTNYNWISGNIVLDRDRYNQPRGFGISLGEGRVAFGVSTGSGQRTICGGTLVLDGQWHHIAAQRRRSDGRLWLFVDGRLDAESAGPGGDLSYPDDGVPGPYCGGPCVDSDPFLVLGAEKHDAGTTYPSYSGWLDELRLSTRLRYSATFARPSAPFVPDADTAALYHFDEGQGNVVGDAMGGSPGVRRFGGPVPGPQWVLSDAPIGGTAFPLAAGVGAPEYRAGDTLTLLVRATAGSITTAVDAYVVLQLPGGSFLSLQVDGRLVPGLVPIARHIVVPHATVPFAFTIPGGTPAGSYTWLAAVAAPGTLSLLSPVASSGFQIVP